MFLTPLIWGFVAVLYFKVAFDVAFYRDISIVASIILGIIFALFNFASTGFFAARLLRFNMVLGRVPAKYSQLLSATIIPFICIVTIYGVAARLVIFGFSKRLNGDIDFLTYRNVPKEDLFIFVIIVTAPFFLHYAMMLFGTYQNANYQDNP